MKRLLIILSLVLLALGTACLQFTEKGKDRLEKATGSRNFGSVSVLLEQRALLFKEVPVSKPHITGTLDEVRVYFDGKNVREVVIDGGKLNVSLQEGSTSGEKSSIPIRARLDNVVVSRDSLTANLKQVTYDNGKVCFEEGDITGHPKLLKLNVKKACVVDRRTGTAESVLALLTTPVREEPVQLEMTGVAFSRDPLTASFDKVTTDHVTLEKGDLRLVGDVWEGSLGTVLLNHPSLAATDVRLASVQVKAPSNLNPVSGSIGGVSWVVDWQSKAFQASGPCEGWLGVASGPNHPLVTNTLLEGALSVRIRSNPSKVELKHTCHPICSRNAPNLDNVKYEAYHPDGKTRFWRTTGRGKPDWVKLTDIPAYIPRAFVTLEDPSFPRHRGILTASLTVALEQNLEKGFFFRGGSTITQQLAKNLWLSREKTLARKANEAALTILLEGCLTKDEILELYLNVVEFGPNVYGIRQGAQHHFKKGPEELTLEESYYLASILPHPNKVYPPGDLERTRKLMKLLEENDRLPEEDVPLMVDAPGTMLPESEWLVN